jgi:hypothetical protein
MYGLEGTFGDVIFGFLFVHYNLHSLLTLFLTRLKIEKHHTKVQKHINKEQLTYLKHKQNKIHKAFKIHGECSLSSQNCGVTSLHLLCTSLHLVSNSVKGTFQFKD